MTEDRDAEFDVAIVGAGINGAGIARDAALRGLKVVVFDKGDMCSATSSISSRLIHGGLRYLEYAEIPLVYESLHERRTLRNIAAHLVTPLRISIPIYEGAKRGPWLIRLGMLLYDILSFNKRLPRHEMLDRDEALADAPGLRSDGLKGTACYYDAQVTYSERLVLENLLAARAAGAEIRTYAEVTGISVCGRSVDAVAWRDDAGVSHETRVRAVINAAGPWVDRVLATAPIPAKRFIGGTKGSHIVVPVFDGAPQDAYYVEAASDGRPFFIIPWNDLYLIGTTDIRYDGDLDEIRASRDEVEYLLAETNRVFPGADLGAADIHYGYAGVRPLPHRDKGPESAITRKHIIKVNRNIANTLVSIIGGKLTTYRNLAEQTVDRLSKLLRRRLPECRTADTLLPGAWGVEAASDRLTAAGLDDGAAARLLAIYGGRATGIADLHGDDSDWLAAEVCFVIREEFPQTLIDIVYRRMMIGLDADQGRGLYERIAATAGVELGWTDDERRAELTKLEAYADSLRVAQLDE